MAVIRQASSADEEERKNALQALTDMLDAGQITEIYQQEKILDVALSRLVTGRQQGEDIERMYRSFQKAFFARVKDRHILEQFITKLQEMPLSSEHVHLWKLFIFSDISNKERTGEITSKLCTFLKDQNLSPEMETAFDKLFKHIIETATKDRTVIGYAALSEILDYLSLKKNVTEKEEVFAAWRKLLLSEIKQEIGNDVRMQKKLQLPYLWVQFLALTEQFLKKSMCDEEITKLAEEALSIDRLQTMQFGVYIYISLINIARLSVNETRWEENNILKKANNACLSVKTRIDKGGDRTALDALENAAKALFERLLALQAKRDPQFRKELSKKAKQKNQAATERTLFPVKKKRGAMSSI